MDATELRAMQAPIKDRYKSDPGAALITLKAKGTLDDQNIACKVETGRALAVAGLHPATGGSGMELCSGDMLLEALVACAGVTLKAVSTALAIPLKSGTVSAEGDLDFRGTLGVAKEAPVGFRADPARASTSKPTRRRRSSTSCSSSPSAIAWCIRPSRAARRSRSRCSGCDVSAIANFASWPGLCRPSTSCYRSLQKVVDGRDKAGHDDARETMNVPRLLFSGSSLALHMAVTAAFVIAAAMMAERSGPAIGALVATLPISAGPSYVFLALDHDAAFIAEGALASLPINGATIVMGSVVRDLAQRHGVHVNFPAAIAVWFAAAALVTAVQLVARPPASCSMPA